jgi:hypothetical protein
MMNRIGVWLVTVLLGVTASEGLVQLARNPQGHPRLEAMLTVLFLALMVVGIIEIRLRR